LTPAALGARVARDAGAVQSLLQQREQAGGESKIVCCLESLEPAFKVTVYHAGRGQSNVKRCLLESEVKDCPNDTSCIASCSDFMKGTRRYRDLVVKKAEKEAADAAAEKARVSAQADKDVQAAKKQVAQAFEGAVRAPREEVAKAGKALEAKTKERADKEAVFRQAKAAEEAAQKDFDAKKSTKEAAEQQAAALKSRVEAEAQGAAASKKQAVDAKLAEKTKQLEQKQQEAARFAPPAVPAECQDPSSPTGAKDCCCSIGQQAVRVSGERFVDWGSCKGAKAYSKTSIWSFPCGYLTPCNKCANLVCGTGMCP